MKDRRILHIDMDAFFASVEQVRDPSLLGKPLIIGGSKEDTRGVVSTASYEAREFGVHSAMPLSEAKRLCPHGIFMRGNFAAYREASLTIREVLEQVSPLVQIASIDEAYIDVTGSRRIFGGDDGIARFIKSEIRRRTNLPCTVAIAPNKLVAKVASDEGKPDGYLRIGAGEERAFFAPLAIGKLPGIGPRMRETLESFGIFTLGQLADMSDTALTQKFGDMGRRLRASARGESESEVEVERIAKSIGRETTFPADSRDWDYVEGMLHHLTEQTMFALRQERMEARRVTLKVRYTGFDTRTLAHTLPEPTALDSTVIETLAPLVATAKRRRDPVRLIGMSLSQLTAGAHQLVLFGGEQGLKWEQALQSVDRLRGKYGFGTVRSARTINVAIRDRLSDSNPDGRGSIE